MKPPICSGIEAAQRVPSPASTGTAPRGSSLRGTGARCTPGSHMAGALNRLGRWVISHSLAGFPGRMLLWPQQSGGDTCELRGAAACSGCESARERSPGGEAAPLPPQGTVLEKGSCFLLWVSASLGVSVATKATEGLQVRAVLLPDVGACNIRHGMSDVRGKSCPGECRAGDTQAQQGRGTAHRPTTA